MDQVALQPFMCTVGALNNIQYYGSMFYTVPYTSTIPRIIIIKVPVCHT